jgi:hypothetical protein
MSKPRKGRSENEPAPREPVDVTDGIPDRSTHGRGWKLLLIVLALLVWIALLIYFQIAGSPGR